MKNLSRKLRYSACNSAVTWLDPVPWSLGLAWMFGRRTSWSMEGGIVTIRGGSDCFMDFSESVFECSNFSSLEYNYSPIILLIGLVNNYLELLITGRVRGQGVVGLARARHCLPCVYTWIGLTWENTLKLKLYFALPYPVLEQTATLLCTEGCEASLNPEKRELFWDYLTQNEAGERRGTSVMGRIQYSV